MPNGYSMPQCHQQMLTLFLLTVEINSSFNTSRFCKGGHIFPGIFRNQKKAKNSLLQKSSSASGLPTCSHWETMKNPKVKGHRFQDGWNF